MEEEKIEKKQQNEPLPMSAKASRKLKTVLATYYITVQFNIVVRKLIVHVKLMSSDVR